MHRRVVCLPILFALFMLFSSFAGAATILWDHPAATTVSGYAVTIDGTRTDHALRVAGAGGACSCSLTVPLAAGTHTVVVAAYNALGESRSAPLTFTVSATSPTPTVLPTGWTSQDIGATGLSGTASYSNGTFTVAAAGADVWGTQDSFHYVHTAMTTDGTVTARVQSLQNTSSVAKAGIMLRASTDPASANVSLSVKPDGGIEFMGRGSFGGATMFLRAATRTIPTWLQLRRTGPTVSALVSSDGITWTTIGGANLSGLTRAGIFVTSANTSVRNTAVFNSVSVTTAADVVIYGADIPSSSLRGAWSRVSATGAAAGVKLTTSDVGVANTSAPLASPRDYVDITFNAVANTPYTLWMRMRARDDNKFNDSLWVQFSDARVNGSRVFAIGSTSGLLLNLATDADATDLSGWGWPNGAYWFTQSRTFTFSTTGPQTMRVQVREDGVEFDQIVLSPSRFLNSAPGAVTNDNTIIPR